MTQQTFDRGMQVRRDLFGPKFSDEEWAATTDFNRPLQDLATRYVFGEVWTREEIPRKLRCLITLSFLVALGRQPQIKNLTRAALKLGATKDEIREVMLQAAIYCGVPAAIDGTRLAMEVFTEEGLD